MYRLKFSFSWNISTISKTQWWNYLIYFQCVIIGLWNTSHVMFMYFKIYAWTFKVKKDFHYQNCLTKLLFWKIYSSHVKKKKIIAKYKYLCIELSEKYKQVTKNNVRQDDSSIFAVVYLTMMNLYFSMSTKLPRTSS